MREIKFRAWDKELKKLGEVYGFDKYKVFASFDRDTDEDAMYELPRNNDVVLMQYTGLKDKNGIEIYEGDILKWKCSRSGETSIKHVKDHTVIIDFNIQFHGYALTIYDNGEKWATNRSYWNDSDREVIGNIYENPELLGKEI